MTRLDFIRANTRVGLWKPELDVALRLRCHQRRGEQRGEITPQRAFIALWIAIGSIELEREDKREDKREEVGWGQGALNET